MDKYVYFWVLTDQQHAQFLDFLGLGPNDPDPFTYYAEDGKYYLMQTEANEDEYLGDLLVFDARDNVSGNDYDTTFFIRSLLPQALWP